MDLPLRRTVSTLLVIAGLATACAIHLKGDPLPGYRLWGAAEAGRQDAGLARIDRFAASATAEGGNAFLAFRGFDGNVPIDEQFMSMTYYRSVYAAYPLRVFVARQVDIVNNGLGITQAAFSPDGAWLRAHGVSAIATFSRDSSGRVQSTIQPIAGAPAAGPAR